MIRVAVAPTDPTRPPMVADVTARRAVGVTKGTLEAVAVTMCVVSE